MQNYSRGKIGIVLCDGGISFGRKVTSHLEKILRDNNELPVDKTILKNSKEIWFSNGEVKTIIDESLRNEDVYIIQDVANTNIVKNNRLLSENDHYMALKTAIDAIRRADAHYITAVIPYFPYSRQDRRKEREGITAKMIARELEGAGANRVITLDIHNEAIEGFFDVAEFENLRGSKNIIDYLQNNLDLNDLVVVAPDEGSIGRNIFYANILKTPFRIFYKERDYTTPNKVDKQILLGDVRDKNALVVDDMIDSAGTMIKSATNLKEAGAKDIFLATSLPVYSGPAIDRLRDAYETGLIKAVFATDAIYHGEDFSKKNPWHKEITVADYHAQGIYNINKGLSMRGLIKHDVTKQ